MVERDAAIAGAVNWNAEGKSATVTGSGQRLKEAVKPPSALAGLVLDRNGDLHTRRPAIAGVGFLGDAKVTRERRCVLRDFHHDLAGGVHEQGRSSVKNHQPRGAGAFHRFRLRPENAALHIGEHAGNRNLPSPLVEMPGRYRAAR